MQAAGSSPPASIRAALAFDLAVLPHFDQWELAERLRRWSTANLLRDHVDPQVLSERERAKVVPRLRGARLGRVRELLAVDPEDLSAMLEDEPVCMRARVHRRHVCRALAEVRLGRIQPPALPPIGGGADGEPPIGGDGDGHGGNGGNGGNGGGGGGGGDTKGHERRDILRVEFCAPNAPVPRGVFAAAAVGKPERPEAHLLCWFILMHPELFLGGKHLLELGAGWGGTAGLTASALMHKRGDTHGRVLLTDMFDGHLEDGAEQFLRETVASARAGRGHPVLVQRLTWEEESERTDALDALGGKVDHILGSDILNYTLNHPRRLLIAAKDLMERSTCCRSDVSFWCVYNNRLGSAHMSGVQSVAKDLDLKLTEIAPRTFIPQRPFPQPLVRFGRGELMLLRFQLYFPN